VGGRENDRRAGALYSVTRITTNPCALDLRFPSFAEGWFPSFAEGWFPSFAEGWFPSFAEGWFPSHLRNYLLYDKLHFHGVEDGSHFYTG
jgi:hypothetical protein